MARNTTKANAKARNAGKADKAGKAIKAKTAKAKTKARRSKAIATKVDARKAVKVQKAKVSEKRARATREYKPKPGTGIEVTNNQRITLKVKTNPKRQGSASYDRFQLYFTKKPKTVGDALKAGITRADIRWDAGQGFIELSNH